VSHSTEKRAERASRGGSGYDVLISFSPFRFEADMGARVTARSATAGAAASASLDGVSRNFKGNPHTRGFTTIVSGRTFVPPCGG
jgi:hypothetical protein